MIPLALLFIWQLIKFIMLIANSKKDKEIEAVTLTLEEEKQKAIEEEVDIDSETEIIETHRTRMRVRDTDAGRAIQQQVEELRQLLAAYRAGLIKER